MTPRLPFIAQCDQCQDCPQCDVNTCSVHGNGDRTTCTHSPICGQCSLVNAVPCAECRWDAA